MEREQAKPSLVAANEVRTARAMLKRGISAGEISMVDLINDPPQLICNLQLQKVLCWQPYLKQKRVVRLCHGIISPTVELGEVGEFTRQRLISRLESLPYTR